MRSFKKIEHEVVMVLGRHGYTLKQKLKDIKDTDTRLYAKGLFDGCTYTVHRGDTSNLTLAFHENYIQITYSAMFILSFDAEGKIKFIDVDNTEHHRYACIIKELKELVE